MDRNQLLELSERSINAMQTPEAPFSKQKSLDVIDEALTTGLNWIRAYESDVSGLSTSTEVALVQARDSLNAAIEQLAQLRQSGVSIQHRLGELAFKYIDRLNDQTPEDSAEKIVAEFLAKANPILSAHFDAKFRAPEEPPQVRLRAGLERLNTLCAAHVDHTDAALLSHVNQIWREVRAILKVSPVETTSPRALRVDRAEAEFIVDAAERTRIPQWMGLAAAVRQLWGMGAFPAGAVQPEEPRDDLVRLRKIIGDIHEATGEDRNSDDDTLPERVRQILADLRSERG